jgi:hypothetical protein
VIFAIATIFVCTTLFASPVHHSVSHDTHHVAQLRGHARAGASAAGDGLFVEGLSDLVRAWSADVHHRRIRGAAGVSNAGSVAVANAVEAGDPAAVSTAVAAGRAAAAAWEQAWEEAESDFISNLVSLVQAWKVNA